MHVAGRNVRQIAGDLLVTQGRRQMPAALKPLVDGAPGEMGAPLRGDVCRRFAPRIELPTGPIVRLCQSVGTSQRAYGSELVRSTESYCNQRKAVGRPLPHLHHNAQCCTTLIRKTPTVDVSSHQDLLQSSSKTALPGEMLILLANVSPLASNEI